MLPTNLPQIAVIIIFLFSFACGAENHNSSSLNQEQSRPVEFSETKTTEMADGTTVTWTRVTEVELEKLGIKDPKAFGEAWRDPSGMIWGDIVKKEDGSPRFMNQKDADAYCKSIGAQLPSGYSPDADGKYGFPKQASDFERLRRYLGRNSPYKYGVPDRYNPQVIPSLSHTTDSEPRIAEEFRSRHFWSSSVKERDHLGISYVYYFDGPIGAIQVVVDEGSSVYNSLRCVFPAETTDID